MCALVFWGLKKKVVTVELCRMQRLEMLNPFFGVPKKRLFYLDVWFVFLCRTSSHRFTERNDVSASENERRTLFWRLSGRRNRKESRPASASFAWFEKPDSTRGCRSLTHISTTCLWWGGSLPMRDLWLAIKHRKKRRRKSWTLASRLGPQILHISEPAGLFSFVAQWLHCLEKLLAKISLLCIQSF